MALQIHQGPGSPLRIPPAEPVRKTRLWSQGEGMSSIEETQQHQEQEIQSGQSLTKQNLLGLADQTNTSPPASISASTENPDLEVPVPEPFWEPDYPSQRFRPKEDEGEDRYYSPPPQMFSPESEKSVENPDLQIVGAAVPEVSLVHGRDLLQHVLT